ncbi:MAG: response regulator transcription factor [Pseudomonadota bacterium]
MSETQASQVLLVEDDTGIGRLLERGLIGSGFDVDWVRDLKSAIARVKSGDHDIVVLDRMLPDGDGAAFCSAIRKFGLSVPVCMLTARDGLEDKLAGFDAGADDYLTKPFEFDELVARLGVLLRRSQPRVQEAVLDLSSRVFRTGGTEIRFTRRELALFHRLISARGQGVSRTDLLAAAWGGEAEVTENSVDVYIGYLRRKLGESGLDIRIDTLRGVGFMLMAADSVCGNITFKE